MWSIHPIFTAYGLGQYAVVSLLAFLGAYTILSEGILQFGLEPWIIWNQRMERKVGCKGWLQVWHVPSPIRVRGCPQLKGDRVVLGALTGLAWVVATLVGSTNLGVALSIVGIAITTLGVIRNSQAQAFSSEHKRFPYIYHSFDVQPRPGDEAKDEYVRFEYLQNALMTELLIFFYWSGLTVLFQHAMLLVP